MFARGEHRDHRDTFGSLPFGISPQRRFECGEHQPPRTHRARERMFAQPFDQNAPAAGRIAVGVDRPTLPAHGPRSRAELGHQALHRRALDLDDRLAFGVVRVDGDLGHRQHGPDCRFCSSERVDHLGLRAFGTPLGHHGFQWPHFSSEAFNPR